MVLHGCIYSWPGIARATITSPRMAFCSSQGHMILGQSYASSHAHLNGFEVALNGRKTCDTFILNATSIGLPTDTDLRRLNVMVSVFNCYGEGWMFYFNWRYGVLHGDCWRYLQKRPKIPPCSRFLGKNVGWLYSALNPFNQHCRSNRCLLSCMSIIFMVWHVVVVLLAFILALAVAVLILVLVVARAVVVVFIVYCYCHCCFMFIICFVVICGMIIVVAVGAVAAVTVVFVVIVVVLRHLAPAWFYHPTWQRYRQWHCNIRPLLRCAFRR